MTTKSGAGYPHGRWAVCLDPKDCPCTPKGAVLCMARWLAGHRNPLLLRVRLERRPEVVVKWRDQ